MIRQTVKKSTIAQFIRMSSKGSPYQSKVTSVEKTTEGGNWIQTRKINYLDPQGKDRVWEMAVRTTRSDTTGIDAVSIVSILKKPNQLDHIVLIKQFRPPTAKVVIELPAGLIDPNETIESTAVRELVEETGYHGTYVKQSPPVFSDPGLTNANMVLVWLDVDLTNEKNKLPKPELEDGEFIETFTLPVKGLLESLHQLMEQEGCTVDARLYHLAVGMSL